MKQLLAFVLLLILSLFGLSFARLNADVVAVDYYFGVAGLPLALLLLSVLAAGVLLGVAVMGLRVISLRRETRRLKQRLAIGEREIRNLRAIPIKDHH